MSFSTLDTAAFRDNPPVMRRRTFLFACIGSFVLIWLIRGLWISLFPLPAPHQDPSCPIQISLSLAPASDDSVLWTNAYTVQPVKIPFFFHCKNISSRNIVISSIFGTPDVHFTCNSWFTKPKKTFFTITGELCWVVLKPGESVSRSCELSDCLIFMTSGQYRIGYTASIEGCFYGGPLPSDSHVPASKITDSDFQKYHSIPFPASAYGQMTISIKPAQSSWGW
jgi:hypothetical protein